MASKFDELLPMIINAGDSGLSAAKITTKFAGKSQAKQRATELRDKLDALVRDGAIWGPLKFRTSQLYFPTGAAPRSRPQARQSLTLSCGLASSCVQRRALRRRRPA